MRGVEEIYFAEGIGIITFCILELHDWVRKDVLVGSDGGGENMGKSSLGDLMAIPSLMNCAEEGFAG